MKTEEILKRVNVRVFYKYSFQNIEYTLHFDSMFHSHCNLSQNIELLNVQKSKKQNKGKLKLLICSSKRIFE